jgi:hypothetical protein
MKLEIEEYLDGKNRKIKGIIRKTEFYKYLTFICIFIKKTDEKYYTYHGCYGYSRVLQAKEGWRPLSFYRLSEIIARKTNKCSRG